MAAGHPRVLKHLAFALVQLTTRCSSNLEGRQTRISVSRPADKQSSIYTILFIVTVTHKRSGPVQLFVETSEKRTRINLGGVKLQRNTNV